jgi:small subunit ribosomal protein S1
VAGKKTMLRKSREDEGKPEAAPAEGAAAPEETTAAPSAAEEPAKPAVRVYEPGKADAPPPAAPEPAPEAPAARETEPPPAAAKPEPAPEPEEEMDFASMLDAAGGFERRSYSTGDRVTTKLMSVGSEDAFFDLGPGVDGVMSRAEILDDDGNQIANIGDELELFVIATGPTVQLSRKMAGGAVDIIALEQAQAARMPVEGKVTGVNKGGLEVVVGGARAFCPLGAMDVVRIEDPASFKGRTLTFLISEIKEGGKNVVLSRRAYLEQERKEQGNKLLEELTEGQVRTGTVSRILDFGAFIDLGGVDGLVPMGEMSWGPVQSADEVVKVGETVTVEVRKIEDDPKRQGEKRIGLSLRLQSNDPWDAHASELQPDATLAGRVQRLESYGAFVELFDGVIGLAHISELSQQRIRHPSDVLAIGDAVTVRVLDVKRDDRRLSLSLRDKISAEDMPKDGERKKGKVTRIERYGVFLQLDDGGEALLPARESGTDPGTDLKRVFPIGTELDVMVIEVDPRGRIKVSRTALESADERAALKSYQEDNDASAGFGTFADLFNKKQGK